MAATAGVGALVPWKLGQAAEQVSGALQAGAAAGAVASPVLAKFVTNPIIPPKIFPAAGSTIELPLAQGAIQMHPALAATPTWGYGGMPVLGPTIEARLNQGFSVKWTNNLPGAHVLGNDRIDPFLDASDPNLYPPVRAVTHLHGGHIPHTVDGGPKAWYVNPNTVPLAPNGQPYPTNNDSHGDTYFYPMKQLRACSLWYHDHALGITRLNVVAGLAGFFPVRDASEDLLDLPGSPHLGAAETAYEIPLAIQDRIFNADGTLYYPPAPHVPEFFGDTIIVNGQVWPRLVVENRKYRFRLLNGCTARFLRMQLITSDMNGVIPASKNNWVPGPAFQQIGTDQGLLNQTAVMPILTMGPGERCDVILDFSKALGNPRNTNPNRRAYYLLYNDAGTPFGNTASTMGAIPEIMLFEVKAMPTGATDPSKTLPVNPNRVAKLDPATAVRTRNITLSEVIDPQGNLMALLGGVNYMDPATETPTIGDVEIWNLINLTPDVHPMHLHQTAFQIIDRIPFDPKKYAKNWAAGQPVIDPTPYYTGAPALLPDANEVGWKDTIRANPAQVTRIIVKWEDYDGEYVWHCHILEHEDHDMMRPLIIAPASAV